MIQKQAIKLNKVVRFVRNALAFFTPQVGDYLVNAISFFSFSFLLNHKIFILSCLARKLV